MPELPDVEILRKKLEKTSINKKIVAVHASGGRVYHSSESTVRRHLLSNSLITTNRHGKNLFIEISDSSFLLMHFGMTGYLKYGKEIPEHSELTLDFNGKGLSYVCPRKFGQLRVIPSPENYIKKKELGPDALSISKKKFIDIFHNSRGMAKTSLMNQKKIAGIGNIYSDEVLYQAGIHPEKTLDKIDKKTLKKLFSVLKRVLRTAIRNKADTKSLPTRYLNYRRNAGRKCPICGGEIKRRKIGNRSAFYCPKHQL